VWESHHSGLCSFTSFFGTVCDCAFPIYVLLSENKIVKGTPEDLCFFAFLFLQVRWPIVYVSITWLIFSLISMFFPALVLVLIIIFFRCCCLTQIYRLTLLLQPIPAMNLTSRNQCQMSLVPVTFSFSLVTGISISRLVERIFRPIRESLIAFHCSGLAISMEHPHRQLVMAEYRSRRVSFEDT